MPLGSLFEFILQNSKIMRSSLSHNLRGGQEQVATGVCNALRICQRIVLVSILDGKSITLSEKTPVYQLQTLSSPHPLMSVQQIEKSSRGVSKKSLASVATPCPHSNEFFVYMRCPAPPRDAFHLLQILHLASYFKRPCLLQRRPPFQTPLVHILLSLLSLPV